VAFVKDPGVPGGEEEDSLGGAKRIESRKQVSSHFYGKVPKWGGTSSLKSLAEERVPPKKHTIDRQADRLGNGGS